MTAGRLLFELVRVVVRFCAAATLTCVAALLVATILPVVFGWRSNVVLTGSMEPGLVPGDLVVSAPVEPATLTPGQVVVVVNPARPGTLLVHRLVRRNPDGTLVTKGDANRAEDSTPVPAGNVLGLARLRVPLVGRPVLWLHEGHGLPVIGVFAGLLVLGGLARPQGPARTPKHAAHRGNRNQWRPGVRRDDSAVSVRARPS